MPTQITKPLPVVTMTPAAWRNLMRAATREDVIAHRAALRARARERTNLRAD